MFPSTTTSTHNAPRSVITSGRTEGSLFSGSLTGSAGYYLLSSLKTRLLAIALLGIAIPFTAYSQVLYGTLTGTVSDQKGAVVPGATVEAHNVGTGVSKETTTDKNGGYQFSDLQPGLYNVTFTLGSFKTLIQEKVRIDANTSRRLDAEMQVASLKGGLVLDFAEVLQLLVRAFREAATAPTKKVDSLLETSPLR